MWNYPFGRVDVATSDMIDMDVCGLKDLIPCMRNSGVFMELAVDAVAYSADTGGPLDW